MWERYCRGVNAIVYMVDAADHERLEGSKQELHNLLSKPQLVGIPVRLVKSLSRNSDVKTSYHFFLRSQHYNGMLPKYLMWSQSVYCASVY